jgi:hypothetical protein
MGKRRRRRGGTSLFECIVSTSELSLDGLDWEGLKLEAVRADVPFSGSYLLPLAIVSLKVLGRLLNEPSLSLGRFANDLAISDWTETSRVVMALFCRKVRVVR